MYDPWTPSVGHNPGAASEFGLPGKVPHNRFYSSPSRSHHNICVQPTVRELTHFKKWGYIKNYKYTSTCQYKAWRKLTAACKAFPWGEYHNAQHILGNPGVQPLVDDLCLVHLGNYRSSAALRVDIAYCAYKAKYYSDENRAPSLESKEPPKAIQGKKQILERCATKKRVIFISYRSAATGNSNWSLPFLPLTLPQYHYYR